MLCNLHRSHREKDKHMVSGKGLVEGASRRSSIYATLICALVLCCVLNSAAPTEPFRSNDMGNEEPITPIPQAPSADVLKIKLGKQLFEDPRLSRDNTRSCSSCHDLGSNGATSNAHDVGIDGSTQEFNTPTVFNSALSFRLGWEGLFRTLDEQAKASLESTAMMGTKVEVVVGKLNADSAMIEQFTAVYGHRPNVQSLLDAIATFERSLVTPGSRFDRWLAGDTTALTAEEQQGYLLFKSLGCASCHQGVNIGGNLFERRGVFHPLASPEPEVLRVPSLRNIATTSPYFHNGSAKTLHDAVKRMGLAQLNSDLTNEQVESIVTYLKTLTGSYQGRKVGASQ
jgi:cytochrome c peroxidase